MSDQSPTQIAASFQISQSFSLYLFNLQTEFFPPLLAASGIHFPVGVILLPLLKLNSRSTPRNVAMKRKKTTGIVK